MNNYYDEHAESFAENTLTVDMQALYAPFLQHLKPGALILDAGCGAGRDVKAFLELGYQVEAFDASQGMVEIANKQLEKLLKQAVFNVEKNTFLSYSRTYSYDAIWACASLLHVEPAELSETFTHLAKLLKDSGVFYASFKYGSGVQERNGRRFTNCNETDLQNYILGSGLEVIKTWQTGDQRAGRETELWLNVLLRKEDATA